MSLSSVLTALSSPRWLDIPAELIRYRGVLTLTKNESRSLLDGAQADIEAEDVQAAQNQLYAGLLLDESRFLGELQKRGILRSSRVSYDTGLLSAIVGPLVDAKLGLAAVVTDYVQSVLNLYAVAQSVRAEYLILRNWLEREKEVGIKSALAWLDLTFLKATVGFHETDQQHITSRHPFFFSIEELSEGLSSLLALYGNEFGVLRTNPPINLEASFEGRYIWVLVSAAHLAAFRDWEVQIDRLGYRLMTTDEPGKFRLVHPQAEFHRAVEMGFIQIEQQRRIKNIERMKDGGRSFHEFAPTLMKQMQDAGLIKIIEHPTPRVTFQFPAEILHATAQVSELFLEERLALLEASRDLLTSPADILDFEVQGGVTFRDLFQVSRLIQFLRSIATARLLPEFESKPGLVLQSIIPVYRRKNLVELLSCCVSTEVAERVIDFWSTDLTGHVDLQYRPFVPVGSEILVPFNVFAGSNVYRNPLQILRKRLYEDGSVDPLSQLLKDSFERKGYEAEIGLKYDQGEIDLLTLIDGIVFALECKNSLVPTGPHELMTSLDYVHTAAGQLGRFRDRFTDDGFREWLAARTGWTLDKSTRVVTGIVLSNRMFMGLRVNGHPVRGAYELEHFIDEGTVAMGDEVHRYWQGDRLTGEDLRRFLEEDVTYDKQWQCLKRYDSTYEFEGCTVLVERLFLDSLALAEIFGFQRAKQGLLEMDEAFRKAMQDFSLVQHYKDRFHGKADPEEV